MSRTTYRIAVKRVGPGNDVALAVDGQPVPGSVVPLPHEGRTEILVDVALGQEPAITAR